MSPEEFEKELLEALKRPEEWTYGRSAGQICHKSGIYYDRYFDRRCMKDVPFHTYKNKQIIEVARLSLDVVGDAVARFDEHLRQEESRKKREDLGFFLSDFGGFR